MLSFRCIYGHYKHFEMLKNCNKTAIIFYQGKFLKLFTTRKVGVAEPRFHALSNLTGAVVVTLLQ